MPETRKTFYLTTPIYYVNARPHIGHAYTTIVADVLARRHRLLGDDTFFLTGTDEHGQKIERSAAAAGIPPQQFADQVSKTFSDLWQRMGITHNHYIRTTDAAHAKGVQKLFATLYEKGFIYLASYTGSYCVSDEAFIDAPIGTPCPDCGRLLEEVTEENFFFKLSEFQEQLIDLMAPDANDNPGKLAIIPKASRNEVLNFLIGNVGAVVAEYNELYPSAPVNDEIGDDGFAPAGESGLIPGLTWGVETKRLGRTANGNYYVPGALRDLSISRSSFTWGIPVPKPAASQAKQPHVIYVWLDALANYMTALGYGSDDETLFQKFWPADLHLVGKEITRFHCVYWPAFLLAAGLPLPKQITANGWLLFDNSKMSKSKGNVVRTETILDTFGTLCPPPPTPPQDIVILSEAKDLLSADQPTPSSEATTQVPQGFSLGSHSGEKEEGALAPEVSPHDRDLFAADVLRYYLLREIPFGQDGSFTFEALVTRYNADLANGYGNLVSRTLNMILKYCGGVIPSAAPTDLDTLQFGRPGFFPHYFPLIEQQYGGHLLTAVANNISKLIEFADQAISRDAPWKLAAQANDESQKQLSNTLYFSAEMIRLITALLYPILPYATAHVWAQLGLGDIEAATREGKLTNLQWGGLQPGTKLGPLGPIFPRADKGLAQIMTDMENPTPAPIASTDPAAAPRTTTLPEPGLTVAGSHATTTGPDTTPSTPSTLNPEPSPQITIDDFAKIDLRVAQITLAERIPKADKLLRLEVDLGPLGTRQILSGIAEHYTPEDLTGRRIVVIANLAPRKMRGLESHGMLLAASDGDHGKPHLATCGDDIALGSRLK